MCTSIGHKKPLEPFS
uniref:Uncharacterized protein n=1 Tax=Arundo donax TaxID=35708 RepID=A0A0A9AS11_ARUDO